MSMGNAFLAERYCLNGKSPIFRTVAQALADQGRLGASFFFKCVEHDRENASLFFITIALDLVRVVWWVPLLVLISGRNGRLDPAATIPCLAFCQIVRHPKKWWTAM